MVNFPPADPAGTGIGFQLGPIGQNVFTGADRSAAETARDNYFTANAGNLTQYNDDTSLNIRLEYTESGNAVAQYQVRNEAGNAWVDNESFVALRGQPGNDGMANVPSLTAGQFVMGGTTPGTLTPAQMDQKTDNIVSTLPLAGPGERTIDIGPISALSEGSTVSFLDRSRSKMFGAVIHETTSGAGIDKRPFYFRPEETFTTTDSAANTSETFTSTTLQFQITNANLGTALEYRNLSRIANSAEITGANLIIRRNSHSDAHPVFDYKRDVAGGQGFTMPGSASIETFTIDLKREHLFLANEVLYITIEGDGSTPLNLRGQTLVGESVPFVDVYGRLGDIVFTEDHLGNPASNGQVLASQTNGTRSWVSLPVSRTDEDIRDVVVALLQAGDNISLTEDDPGNTLTIASAEPGTALTSQQVSAINAVVALTGTGDVRISGGTLVVVDDSGGTTPPPGHTNQELQYGKNTSASLPGNPLTADDTAVENQWTVEFPALTVGDYWVFRLPAGRSLTSIINPSLPGVDQQASWTQDGGDPRLWYIGPAIRTSNATTLQITSTTS